MKIMAMIAIAAMAGMSAQARKTGQAEKRKVMVCVKAEPNDDVVRAQAIASRMFAKIGVSIEWHNSLRACPASEEPAIVVSLNTHTSENDHPGAMGFAEGDHIQVLYDRVDRDHARVRYLLAHVLVHEITHVLQGVGWHAETGVMKAQWDEDDLFQMTRKPLPFTEYDVLLIQKGLDARMSDRIQRHASSLDSLQYSTSAGELTYFCKSFGQLKTTVMGASGISGRPHHNPDDFCGCLKRPRFIAQDSAHYIGCRDSSKRTATREHFVQYRAKTEYIGAHIERLPLGLLGSHVGRRAQHRAFDRTCHVGICFSYQLCQSEVEEFHRPAFGDHDVSGLQIVVDDAFAVRRFQCFGNLPCVVESSLKWERSLKRLALDEFHHQRSIFDAVNLRDIGMVERR